MLEDLRRPNDVYLTRMYAHAIDTKAGVLIFNDPDESGWIYSRFVEPKRASEFVSCNPYTGKWNDYDIEDFERRLTRLIGS